MIRRFPLAVLALAVLAAPVHAAPARPSPRAPALSPSGAPVTPESFLGFRVGADRKLADYGQIVRYFGALARSSDRVLLDTLGTTTLGRPLVMAVISSAANLRDPDRWREVTRRLADPRGLSQDEAERLIGEGKVILLITCSIHSTEIGASQMAMEWAWDLATSEDPQVLQQLDDVILLLVPSLNPDGTDLVVDWYRKYLGTQYEGGRMPWLYHHYAGHDDNRDWFMLNLAETRLVNRVLHHTWFPQVYLDEHQMGQTAPRIFVPPYADPVTPLVHPLQWRLTDLIGTSMAWRLEQARKQGVIYEYLFDAYWPGGTKNTACLKNVIGLLTELASCRVATPVFVDANELSGGAKGLPDYRLQHNFPNPWPGGTWRLRDIVDYELIASNSLLETCSRHRAEILRAFYEMGLEATERGRSEAPYAYVVPPLQGDPAAARRMIEILRENGLEARRAEEDFTAADGRRLPKGSVVFLAAQPYRSFLLEMMERQRYPEVRQSPDAKDIFRPYDVTAWTLPLMMGVSYARVDAPFEARLPVLQGEPWPAGRVRGPAQACWAVPATSSAAVPFVNRLLANGIKVERALQSFTADGLAFAPGAFLVRADDLPEARAAGYRPEVDLAGLAAWPAVTRVPLRAPRIGLYKPWLASEDEGWTRFVLDQNGFRYTSLDNAALKAASLNARFDVIVLPDVRKDIIVDGRRKAEDGPVYQEPMPPPYAGGIGKEGVANLKDFVEQGGTLVCLSASAALPLEEFNLPVRDVVAKAKPGEFSVPGALVNLRVDNAQPLGFGLPEQCVAFCTGGPVFATSPPGAGTGRAVVARYPEYKDQVVESGWAEGTALMTGRAAVVDAQLGRGRVVLFGPRVQNRAQMVGTFKFLFNALYSSVTER